RERRARLEHDRKLMTVTAPADGIVFYGRAEHGQFPANPNNPVVQRLVLGGSLSPEEVFMTVVTPRPALVYATAEEKDLHLLKVGQKARVKPAGYPDARLAATLKALGPVRLPGGGFLAVVDLDGAPDTDLRPAMTCTVKVPVYEKADALLVPTA